MKQIDMQDRCLKNKNFREYVDRFCKTHNQTVEEVLSHALVQEVARYYIGVEVEKNSKISAEKSTYVPMGECV